MKLFYLFLMLFTFSLCYDDINMKIYNNKINYFGILNLTSNQIRCFDSLNYFKTSYIVENTHLFDYPDNHTYSVSLIKDSYEFLNLNSMYGNTYWESRVFPSYDYKLCIKANDNVRLKINIIFSSYDLFYNFIIDLVSVVCFVLIFIFCLLCIISTYHKLFKKKSYSNNAPEEMKTINYN